MIIVKIWGGLGNQLFQYSFAKKMAIEQKKNLYIDASWFYNNKDDTKRDFLLDGFCDDIAHANKLCLNSCLSIIKITKIIFGFKNQIKDSSSESKICNFFPIYIDGYWQSKNSFDFENKIFSENAKKKIQTNKKETNSVAIHIRRGDYLNLFKNNEQIYEICNHKYYVDALNVVEKKIKNPKIYIFSDDIDWVRKNIFFPHETVYVDSGNATDDFFDMASCNHHIIANSTYSWWAACFSKWAIDGDKICVMPAFWKKTDINPNKEMCLYNWTMVNNRNGS